MRSKNIILQVVTTNLQITVDSSIGRSANSANVLRRYFGNIALLHLVKSILRTELSYKAYSLLTITGMRNCLKFLST